MILPKKFSRRLDLGFAQDDHLARLLAGALRRHRDLSAVRRRQRVRLAIGLSRQRPSLQHDDLALGCFREQGTELRAERVKTGARARRRGIGDVGDPTHGADRGADFAGFEIFEDGLSRLRCAFAAPYRIAGLPQRSCCCSASAVTARGITAGIRIGRTAGIASAPDRPRVDSRRRLLPHIEVAFPLFKPPFSRSLRSE